MLGIRQAGKVNEILARNWPLPLEQVQRSVTAAALMARGDTLLDCVAHIKDRFPGAALMLIQLAESDLSERRKREFAQSLIDDTEPLYSAERDTRTEAPKCTCAHGVVNGACPIHGDGYREPDSCPRCVRGVVKDSGGARCDCAIGRTRFAKAIADENAFYERRKELGESME